MWVMDRHEVSAGPVLSGLDWKVPPQHHKSLPGTCTKASQAGKPDGGVFQKGWGTKDSEEKGKRD